MNSPKNEETKIEESLTHAKSIFDEVSKQIECCQKDQEKVINPEDIKISFENEKRLLDKEIDSWDAHDDANEFQASNSPQGGDNQNMTSPVNDGQEFSATNSSLGGENQDTTSPIRRAETDFDGLDGRNQFCPHEMKLYKNSQNEAQRQFMIGKTHICICCDKLIIIHPRDGYYRCDQCKIDACLGCYNDLENFRIIDAEADEYSQSEEQESAQSSESSSGTSKSSSYHSSEDFHENGSDTLSVHTTPEQSQESSEDSMTKEAPPIPKAECVQKPQKDVVNPLLYITAQQMLKAAWDLKEQGNSLYKKKYFLKAIAKYRMIEMFTRAVKPPVLPDLQIAKSEEEVKEDKERCKEAGATGDPRDPRNDPNTPRSMQDIEKMTKWMEIPKLWKELPDRRSQLVIEPSEADLRVCKEIQGSAYLNISLSYFGLKNYQRSAFFAQQSTFIYPSIKAFYRQAICHKIRKEYCMSIFALKESLKIAEVLKQQNQCEDIIKEINVIEKLEKNKEKARIDRMSGFLIKANKK